MKLLKKILNRWCERGQKCSCFVDGIKNPFNGKWAWYWGSCCKAHDEDYQEQVGTKEQADCKFYKCLQKKAGKIMAWVMLKGVSGKVGQANWDGYKRK